MVKVLTVQFFPANPSLLGLNTNSGQKINLRLRPPGEPDGFYEFDQLVLVMLHEVCPARLPNARRSQEEAHVIGARHDFRGL